MEKAPLHGVRVLELAGLAPAPFCGMILADFGADVIRVDRQGDSSGARDFLARGKRSIAINLKKKEGIQALLKLIEKADVLIDPYRPGVAERLGIGPEIATKVNPKLIYARLTGWGQTGPYANMAGHDINYIAISGALSVFGQRSDSPPSFPVNLLGDFAGGGLMCALGIVLALFERSKSNKGQVIDADGVSYINSFIYQMFKLGAWKLERGTNTLDGAAPFYDVYKTKDGKYISVGCLEPQFFTLFIKGLGLDPNSFDQMDESSWPQMRKIFSETIASKTRSEWEKTFDGTDSCVGKETILIKELNNHQAPILSLDEFDIHFQNIARKTVVNDNNGNSHISPAPKLSRTPAITPRGSVMLESGAHSKFILKEFGFSLSEIENLIQNEVISSQTPNSAL